jgi:NOL1/NOP2/fmu family ribosome biogenesis protein
VLSIPSEYRGWTLVTTDGLPLGWGKASGGQLKNHLPKGLRNPK